MFRKIVSLMLFATLTFSNISTITSYAIDVIEDEDNNDEDDIDDEDDDDSDEELPPEVIERPDSIVDFDAMSDENCNDGSSELHPFYINIKTSKYIKLLSDYDIKRNKITFKVEPKYKKYFTVTKYGLVTANKVMKYNYEEQRMNVACIIIKMNDESYNFYVTCQPASNVKFTWKKKVIKFKYNIASPENATAQSNITFYSYYKSFEPDKLVNFNMKDLTLTGNYKKASLESCGVIRLNSETGLEEYYANEKLATAQKVTKDRRKYFRIKTIAVPKSIYYDENGNILTNSANASSYKKEAYQVFKWTVDGAVTYFKVKIAGKLLY